MKKNDRGYSEYNSPALEKTLLKDIPDLIVVGGGASGVFAAIEGAKIGKKVMIIERNKTLLKKLSITGKGRCNITNNTDINGMMKNIPRNPKFLYSALSACSSETVIEFFEKNGLPLKTERGGRIFPVSDKAEDVKKILEKQIKKLNIKVIEDRILSVKPVDQNSLYAYGEKGKYQGKKILIATGGMSYPKTGSTGDGYKIAEKLGHTIIPLKPSLVPVKTVENTDNLMGLSLKNVDVSLCFSTDIPLNMSPDSANLLSKKRDKIVFKERGEMIFTHFGLSGPLILSLSSYIESPQKGEYIISIDLKPALDYETLDKRLLRDFEEFKNRILENSLRKLLPGKLIPELISRTGIDPQKKVNEITKAERQTIISNIKNFNFIFKDFLPIECGIITDGGISVKEINPKTMESKLVKGLYFSGEIIDTTGFTGGFNLQIAFSTGQLAAASC